MQLYPEECTEILLRVDCKPVQDLPREQTVFWCIYLAGVTQESFLGKFLEALIFQMWGVVADPVFHRLAGGTNETFVSRPPPIMTP
jgi:hypothetical protein